MSETSKNQSVTETLKTRVSNVKCYVFNLLQNFLVNMITLSMVTDKADGKFNVMKPKMMF